jgi:hypothetical protein
MKELKIIFAIILTFIIAFGTSALLEIPFFYSKWPRYGLVVLVIAVELVIGVMYVKSEVQNLSKNQN